MPKSRSCTRCHKPKPIAEFAKSPHSDDGYMKVCRKCWSTKLSKAKKAASKARKAGKAPAAPVKRRKKNGVDSANQALEKSNGKKDKFMVRASDGDQKEFRTEAAALKRAMQWKIAGYAVEVWRKCELELVARIRG